MKIAIMQPYLFPYIGYFQLIESVDRFVVYDTVNFINRGWINRNNVLVAGQQKLFTVPLAKKSQNTLIKHMQINDQDYPQWREKFVKTLTHAYAKSNNFAKVIELIQSILCREPNSLAELCVAGLQKCCEYLDISTEILIASELAVEHSGQEQKADKLISICKHLGCSHYINSPGGIALYSKAYFSQRGIELDFIQPHIEAYPQLGTDTFISHLSIIDVLMNASQSSCQSMVKKYAIC